MIVDGHHHFWSLARGDYDFPSPDDAVLYRDSMPADLVPLMEGAGVAAGVVVQATESLEETAFLLGLADENPTVAGVVGWWDPRRGATLDRLMELPHAHRLVGARPMLQKSDDAGWLTGAEAGADLARLADRQLVFDALIDARHVATIEALAVSQPQLAIAVNHMAKPWRRAELIGEWRRGMRALAGVPNCVVKVSGFPFDQGEAALAALVAEIRDLFGPARLLWGSDWPVVNRTCDYAGALQRMLPLIPDDERAAVFCDNAVSLYRLGLN